MHNSYYRTYVFEELERQYSIRPEQGRRSALLVQQAWPSSLKLEIVLKFRVALDAVSICALYPLTPYARPERAGLIRSVDIENIQPFAARDSEVGRRRPKTVALTEPVVFYMKNSAGVDEKKLVPAGTAVQLIRVRGEWLMVVYEGSYKSVPVTATDILDQMVSAVGE